MNVRSALLAIAAVAAAGLMTGIAVSPAMARAAVAAPYSDLNLAGAGHYASQSVSQAAF